jgi:hypothetical protein
LAAPYAGEYSATLRVALLGFGQYEIDPDHHAVISLNGVAVADEYWDGFTWRIGEADLPQSMLVTGTNTITITAPNDTGADTDTIFIDWIELDYARTFVAEGDQLRFTYGISGAYKFQVHGFSNDDVEVYDVTTPAAVVQLEGVELPGSGPFSAVYEDTLVAPIDYWVVASTAYQAVWDIEQDTSPPLESPPDGVDHIAIAPKAFASQAAALRDLRASQGLDAVAVDVEEVYDEFGYGIAGAAPIHDFLAYAYENWQAPSYVVLIGDGHYDPNDYGGYGRASHIPPYLAMADPATGETVADNRYVNLVGSDNLPDMMLGRLAVNTGAEASAFVDKIIAYEETPETGDWLEQVLFVADNGDGAGNFPQMSDDLQTCCLPSSYQTHTVYWLNPYTDTAEARTAIQDSISDGKLIVNYIGHAAAAQWADEGLFKAADVAGLSNLGKYPVFLPMTCRDGYYIYPFSSNACIAEVVTRADGKGAVASWSPTGMGNASEHDFLDRGFFSAVFYDPDGQITLGEATTAGLLNLWATGTGLDLLDTYLLFGDPATLMALPHGTAVELVEFEATALCGSVELEWETASEVDNAGFNLYRAAAYHGERVRVNEELIPSQAEAGAVYQYTDWAVLDGPAYYYWLENVDLAGRTGLSGPIEVQIVCGRHVYLPSASGSWSSPPPGPD